MNHPAWALLRLTVLMVTLCVVLYLEAESFDSTELRSILWIFLAAAGFEGAVQAGVHAFKDKS